MPVSGQVALFGVDRALLNVRPHPIRNLSTSIVPSLPRDMYATTDTYESLVAPHSINLTATRLQEMVDADPWLPLAWPLRPGGSLI